MSKVYNPALQERLESYLANSGISQAKLAPKVGISQTALSQYRRSKYDNGDIAELERKLEEFFRTEEAVEAAAVKAAPYVDIEVLNENFRKIDASASSLEVTLRIEADETTVVAVSHSSGTYSGISTQHTEDGTSVTRTYAEFKLPCGGDATFMYTVGGKNFCDSACLMNGAVEWIMCGHTTIHHSILAKVPENHFKSNASVQVADDAGVIQTIRKVDFNTLQSGYTADLDHQNELWHAVRCGLITSAQYKTITGDAYPSTPPTRVD